MFLHKYFYLCVGDAGSESTPQKVLICRKFGQKWRPAFAEKHRKTFFGVRTEKGLHDLCGRKSAGKVAQKLFGQVWEN